MTMKDGYMGYRSSPDAQTREPVSEDAIDRAIDETIRRYFMRHEPPARAYARVLGAAQRPSAPRRDGSAVRSWVVGIASATAALLLVNVALHALGVVSAQVAPDANSRTSLFLLWLSSTSLARWVNESETIVGYSGILFLHTLGLAVTVGASVVVDLRMLGAASRISVGALLPLFRYMWLGFAVNAVSGAMLFAADAPRKAANPLFELKLALIAIGVAVMALMERRLLQAQSGVPLAASQPRLNALAIASLVIWAAAIAAGRLVAYTF
jgi:hypothetical protein